MFAIHHTNEVSSQQDENVFFFLKRPTSPWGSIFREVCEDLRRATIIGVTWTLIPSMVLFFGTSYGPFFQDLFLDTLGILFSCNGLPLAIATGIWLLLCLLAAQTASSQHHEGANELVGFCSDLLVGEKSRLTILQPTTKWLVFPFIIILRLMARCVRRVVALPFISLVAGFRFAVILSGYRRQDQPVQPAEIVSLTKPTEIGQNQGSTREINVDLHELIRSPNPAPLTNPPTSTRNRESLNKDEKAALIKPRELPLPERKVANNNHDPVLLDHLRETAARRARAIPCFPFRHSQLACSGPGSPTIEDTEEEYTPPEPATVPTPALVAEPPEEREVPPKEHALPSSSVAQGETREMIQNGAGGGPSKAPVEAIKTKPLPLDQMFQVSRAQVDQYIGQWKARFETRMNEGIVQARTLWEGRAMAMKNSYLECRETMAEYEFVINKWRLMYEELQSQLMAVTQERDAQLHATHEAYVALGVELQQARNENLALRADVERARPVVQAYFAHV